jgi:hypothetical protein
MSKHLKKPIFSLATAFLGATFYILFPAQEYTQAYISGIVFLVLLPLLVIRFIFKDSLVHYGFGIKPTTETFKMTAFFFIGSLFCFVLLLFLFPQIAAQSRSRESDGGFLLFLIYAFILTGIQIFLYDFIFRAFLQRSWEKILGVWSIGFQFLCLLAFLFASQSLSWASTSILFSGLISGFIMQTTRSFFLCFFFSWLFAIISNMIISRFFS